MADLARIESLLEEMVQLQRELVDRLDSLEQTVADSNLNREADILAAVNSAVGDSLTSISDELEQVKKSLDPFETHSMAAQLVSELQWHEDLSFAGVVIKRLDSVEQAIRDISP
jgi:hypothetical protein